jgi:hypothetical protein
VFALRLYAAFVGIFGVHSRTCLSACKRDTLCDTNLLSTVRAYPVKQNNEDVPRLQTHALSLDDKPLHQAKLGMVGVLFADRGKYLADAGGEKVGHQ